MQSDVDQADKLIGMCDQILAHISEAQRYLKSAKNWGLLDIFGGGMLVTFLKHRKVDSVHQELEAANRLLSLLGAELKRVHESDRLYIEVGDFGYFADYFFDGIFADLYFQNKMSKLGQQVSDMEGKVSEVREALVKARRYALGRT